MGMTRVTRRGECRRSRTAHHDAGMRRAVLRSPSSRLPRSSSPRGRTNLPRRCAIISSIASAIARSPSKTSTNSNFWRESEPEAPEGQWVKDFGSFKISGEAPFAGPSRGSRRRGRGGSTYRISGRTGLTARHDAWARCRPPPCPRRRVDFARGPQRCSTSSVRARPVQQYSRLAC
jgi:hypothetical protein